jgi:hypothetical protein
MNAFGTYVPPMTWPRKNIKAVLMDRASSGSVAACHSTGWVQTDIYTMRFDHFLKFVKPNPEEPVLLVIDGHYTHTRNVEVIEKARKNHIAIVCLPPHTSHRMQPLDVGSCFHQKHTYYWQEVETWLANNPNRVVTPYLVSKLFVLAYKKAVTMEISVSAFQKMDSTFAISLFSVTTTFQFIFSTKIRIIVQPMNQWLSLSLKTQNVLSLHQAPHHLTSDLSHDLDKEKFMNKGQNSGVVARM